MPGEKESIQGMEHRSEHLLQVSQEHFVSFERVLAHRQPCLCSLERGVVILKYVHYDCTAVNTLPGKGRTAWYSMCEKTSCTGGTMVESFHPVCGCGQQSLLGCRAATG